MNIKKDQKVNYYVVQAKCGHVGKGKFIAVDFPIKAVSAREAAYNIRQRPGVKHEHSNAILSVRKVNIVEYLLFERIFDDDLYWKRARRNYEALLPRIRDEVPFHRLDKPSLKNEVPEKTNKKEARPFRVKRNNYLEESLRRDVIMEFGLDV